MKKVEIILLLVFLISCQKFYAQTNLNMTTFNNYNFIFDRVIKEDTTLLLDFISKQETNNFHKVSHSTLKFDSTSTYYDLSEILDNDTYLDIDKIQLLHDIINYNKKDWFENIHSVKIDFWHRCAPALEIIENYLKKKVLTHQESEYLKFQYIEFRVRNQFPDAYSFIKDYFNQRPTFIKKMPFEGILIGELIRLEKFDEALLNLEILIDDYFNKKTDYLFIDTYIRKLCFSNNQIIKDRATNILLKYLERIERGGIDQEWKSAFLLNKEVTIKILKQKFDYYTNIDFSHLDYSKNDFNLIYEHQKVSYYVDFMRFCLPYLNEIYGKDIWNEFVLKIPFWEKYQNSPFIDNQLTILSACLNDKRLTLPEKEKMLLQIKQSEQLFSDGFNKQKYINCIRKVYISSTPSLDMLKKLNISLDDFRNFNRIYFKDYYKIYTVEKIISDLNIAGMVRKNINTDRFNDFSKFEDFLKNDYSYYDFYNDHFDKYFFQTGLVNRIMLPHLGNQDNFKIVFDKYFKPFLEQNGIKDIFITQQTIVEQNQATHTVFVNSNFENIQFEIIVPNKSYCDYKKLSKSINFILANRDLKFRFIEVKTLDFMSRYQEYVFFEPSRLRDLLDKYEIACWAIDERDEFSNSKTQ